MATTDKGSSAAIVKAIERLDDSLRVIANCLGLLVLATSELKDGTATQKIPFLSRLGYDRNAIADMVGTTPETVSTRLSEAKKKSK